MRKLLVLVVLVLFGPGSVYAGSIEGVVKNVDAAAKKLEISHTPGSTTVIGYQDSTKWPAGVTNPLTLLGKQIKVQTDENNTTATSVEEVKGETSL